MASGPNLSFGQVAVLFFRGRLARGSRYGEFSRAAVATALCGKSSGVWKKGRHRDLLLLLVPWRRRCFAENWCNLADPR